MVLVRLWVSLTKAAVYQQFGCTTLHGSSDPLYLGLFPSSCLAESERAASW